MSWEAGTLILECSLLEIFEVLLVIGFAVAAALGIAADFIIGEEIMLTHIHEDSSCGQDLFSLRRHGFSSVDIWLGTSDVTVWPTAAPKFVTDERRNCSYLGLPRM